MGGCYGLGVSSCSDPKHYLALLEQKPGALDQAAPLQRLDLARGSSSASAVCSRARMGNRGKKEFIQFCGWMEAMFEEAIVSRRRRRTPCSSARSASTRSSNIVLARIERRPPRLDLARYPYLARRRGEDHVRRPTMPLAA